MSTRAAVPLPLLFAESIGVGELPIAAYDPSTQTSGLDGALVGLTTYETATGGHGDTDTDTDE